jgi:hypothetical protein
VLLKCPECTKCFSSKPKVSQHISDVHKIRYTCTMCSMQFAKTWGLKQHLNAASSKCNPSQISFATGTVEQREAHAKWIVAQEHYDKYEDPEFKAKQRKDWRAANPDKCVEYYQINYQKVMDKKISDVDIFLTEHGLTVNTKPLTHQDAFDRVLKLIEDKESSIGKLIFKTLGMTLRTAFWEGQYDGAMYALVTRGDAASGGKTAEATQFLFREHGAVIAQEDGTKFQYTSQKFKDLSPIFIPIAVFNTYSDVTTMESAFQQMFDFLEIGRHRLWQWSGNGRTTLSVRKCDMKYMEQSGNMHPTFMFGITILPNVHVIDRVSDTVGNNAVASITAGLDVKCQVYNSKRKMIQNDEQRIAMEKVYATLPPHFMTANMCRKRKAEFIQQEEPSSSKSPNISKTTIAV